MKQFWDGHSLHSYTVISINNNRVSSLCRTTNTLIKYIFVSRFSLQTRRGGLVKIYDSVLNSNSQYKSLLISARTTVDEVISLLLNCYNSKERVEQFSLYEVNTDKEQQRKLHPDDRPLHVQQMWLPSHQCHFLVRRNPDYLPLSRRKVKILLLLFSCN